MENKPVEQYSSSSEKDYFDDTESDVPQQAKEEIAEITDGNPRKRGSENEREERRQSRDRSKSSGRVKKDSRQPRLSQEVLSFKDHLRKTSLKVQTAIKEVFDAIQIIPIGDDVIPYPFLSKFKNNDCPVCRSKKGFNPAHCRKQNDEPHHLLVRVLWDLDYVLKAYVFRIKDMKDRTFTMVDLKVPVDAPDLKLFMCKDEGCKVVKAANAGTQCHGRQMTEVNFYAKGRSKCLSTVVARGTPLYCVELNTRFFFIHGRFVYAFKVKDSIIVFYDNLDELGL